MSDYRAIDYDVVIVGAGFAGLYAIHKMREQGLSIRCFEAGDGVGGVWFWNRYPGIRCDIESMQYSYSFDRDLQNEWDWSEHYAPGGEICAYLNHVADRFDLRRDITFNTRVTAAHFDGDAGLWRVTADQGEALTTRVLIMATGSLSASQIPDIPGLGDFSGGAYHTAEWPHDGVDFSGRRVAVIGTGSSGIQCIPEIAEAAGQLTVFQRTPNFSIPAQNRAMSEEYRQDWRENYDERRRYAKEECPSAVVREFGPPSAKAVDKATRDAEYQRRWQIGGAEFMSAYRDIPTDLESNATAADFVRERIADVVRDPETAGMLSPRDYPIGTKRICVDNFYFETYNRPNVRLVDLKETPIERIEAHGIRTSAGLHEFDDIVLATGFDALTGPLTRADIRGRGNLSLKDKWADGPKSYLGIMVAGFPNMFTVTGPGSPSVLANVVIAIEQHIELIADLLVHMAKTDVDLIEPEPQAELDWGDEVNAVVERTLFSHSPTTWYMGANIPGKRWVILPYAGGFHNYCRICNDMVADGYRGFRFSSANGDRLKDF